MLSSYGIRVIAKPEILANRRILSWSDLDGQSLAVMEGSGTLRNQVENLRQAHHTGPKLAIECTSYPQLIEACHAYGFVTIVPAVAKRAVAAFNLGICRLRELDEFEFPVPRLELQRGKSSGG